MITSMSDDSNTRGGALKMKSRRAFIKFAALSPLASALPVLSCAATPFSGKFVVTLQAIGGWDVTCFCDPKENQPGEATITQWSKTDEAKSIGRIKYAPFAKNEAFFRKHASKMLVINGVDTLTNAHSIGETTSWSGRIASGYPSITTLYSAAFAPDLPLSYITFGGYNQTENLLRATQLGWSVSEIKSLLKPNSYQDGSMIDERLWSLIKTFHVNDIESTVKSSQITAGSKATRKDYITSLRAMDPLSKFSETLPDRFDWEQRTENGHLRQQVQFTIAAFKAGLSASADLYHGGFDSHGENDAFQTVALNELTDGIDFLWDAAEEAGIADRLIVIIGSDFSRTPYYNSGDGKDHWSVGSYIIMEKGKGYTNRYIDGSDEGQNALKIDPNTLQRSGFGTKILTSHVHGALRDHLGLANSAAADLFPLRNTERFNFFS
tara:strand:+ start:1547 stop:2857 length:1311 start_codon:yes stop_codon:yes gene_type:complete